MFTLCQLIITNSAKQKISNRIFQIGVKCYMMVKDDFKTSLKPKCS